MRGAEGYPSAVMSLIDDVSLSCLYHKNRNYETNEEKACIGCGFRARECPVAAVVMATSS
jgi:formate hydrogenlyase subunit 6/NADH:ubiquinone oxidoreductase subunit I